MPCREDLQFRQGSLRARRLACSNAERDRSSFEPPPPRHYPFNSLLRSLMNGDSTAIAKLGHWPITGSLKLKVEPLPASLSTRMAASGAGRSRDQVWRVPYHAASPRPGPITRLAWTRRGCGMCEPRAFAVV